VLAGFWDQATKQADAAELIPCLAWRANRHPWQVTIPLSWLMAGAADYPCSIEFTATLPLEAFCLAVRER
jgi:hypothetical protein